MSAHRPSAVRFGQVALALGGALAGSVLGGLDHRIADWLFRLEGGRWQLRRDPLFAHLLHDLVQRVCLIYYVTIVLAFLVCLGVPSHRRLMRVLGYVALANTLCIAAVGLGKELLPIPCPWDLQRYGGALPQGGVLDWQSDARVKGCFPSGHAVGGYALFAWFFVARRLRPHLALRALGVATTAGLTLGLVQQARGAHFVSHDLACALLCWLLSGAVARVLPRARSDHPLPPPTDRCAEIEHE